MPRLLDLFCGAGGAGEGYRRAGFDVTGSDLEEHDYPAGDFFTADAMEVLKQPQFLDGFDVVHASPPCQGYTTMSAKHKHAHDNWPKLIAPVRDRLTEWGGLFVIENVPGARREMRDPITLSGGMFGLGVDRPRLFESNAALIAMPHRRPDWVVGVYGRDPDGRLLWRRADGSELRAARGVDEGRRAMGIDWMTWDDLREAIPPAYTEFIGHQLMGVINANSEASTPGA